MLIIAVLGWVGRAFGGLPAWVLQPFELLNAFAAIFLGIFIEAVPYLLMGTLASGLVEVFFKREDLASLIPKTPLGGALAGSLLGLFFPVCECGVVPLTRRLLRKGIPLPVGVAFLLAAPVLNPIVIASTLAAFGIGTVFWGRMLLSLVIAASTALIFSLHPDASQMLRPAAVPLEKLVLGVSKDIKPPAASPPQSIRRRLREMLAIAGDEFFEMGRFLVIGAALAALMQTFVPQTALLSVGRGPFFSVLVMIGLGVLLSICSTVDAFIALAFTATFTTGSLLAFLVFGPMVDIKSTLMFLRVFKPRFVVYLILLPLMMTILATVAMNYFTGW